MAHTVKFKNKQQSTFFEATRIRVDAYFQDQDISKHANRVMWAKTAFFLGGFLFIYFIILSNQFTGWTLLALAILLGLFDAFVGINISHDAIHGSFSGNKTVNKILSHTFNLIGANPYVWSISHNIVHHTYTNIPDHDEDLMMAPNLIRINPNEEVKPFQRYQHLYAFWLYGFTSLYWLFIKDYVRFFQKKIGQRDNQNHPKIEYFNLFFFKAAYYVLFIVLPLLFLDITWWQFLLGFSVMHLIRGWVIALVFQVSHLVEVADFPAVDTEGSIEESWAVHQMHTTANFSRKSTLANFFYGGLNLQIEHHLFPKICHIHYPAISDIVKNTAQEFGVPYLENSTFLSALQSHYQMLKRLGAGAHQEKLQHSGMRHNLQ